MSTQPETVPALPVADRLTPPLPTDPAEVMRRGQQVANALRRFVRKHPEQIVAIDGSRHPRAEAWQFVAACYGHTALVTSTEQLLEEDPGFIAVAHLRNAAGEIVSGAEAVCMRSEEFWSDKEAFQLRSNAQTRACAKVTRNVFAWIMVLAGFSPTPAEEMEYTPGNHSHAPMTGKKCSECGNQLSDKRWRDTRQKFGKALCLDHEKIASQAAGEQLINVVNDPKFVEESVRQVKARKANGAQPIAELLDKVPKHKDAYSL